MFRWSAALSSPRIPTVADSYLACESFSFSVNFSGISIDGFFSKCVDSTTYGILNLIMISPEAFLVETMGLRYLFHPRPSPSSARSVPSSMYQIQTSRLSTRSMRSMTDQNIVSSVLSSPKQLQRYRCPVTRNSFANAPSPAFEFGQLDTLYFRYTPEVPLICLTTLKKSSLSFTNTFADEDKANNHTQIGSPWLPDPGSTPHFSIMKQWLSVCQKTHNHDQSTPRPLSLYDLPTRVIDCSPSGANSLRLTDSIVMVSQDYTAFSHCWGQSLMFTTNNTINDLRIGIDFATLPPSFQDAVTVTRGLGIRYLWIDSLCIIQDNKEDWDHEATRMQHVFSNATCVIAASSASSSSQGFLQVKRPPRPSVTVRSPKGELLYICKSIDNFHRDVEEAVLNKRGWVLQERALARRSIHFTSTQLYMECGKGVHCETLTKLVKYVLLSRSCHEHNN